MFRKILVGGVIATLSAGLIYGGVYRTIARTETGEASREGIGHGEGSYAGQNESKEYDRGFDNNQANTGNRGGFSSGQSGEKRGGTGSETYETVEYSGTVAEVTNDWMTIQLEDGSEIRIENRAWWYAQDAGFTAMDGDPVQVSGFIDDDGILESSTLLNLNSGVQVEIRGEQGGRPNWAGGGGGNRRG